MNFLETKIPGAFLIALETSEDERGFFARTFCENEFRVRGLDPRVAQCSVSFNRHKGTLRGMHYQVPPHAEAKLVRCTRGAVYDVIADTRESFPTFRQWAGIELSATNGKMLYIPKGVAHGFQTLEDSSEVFYQISESYHPESARGFAWNDVVFSITWPLTPTSMSHKDRSYPPFEDSIAGSPHSRAASRASE
jgi:dTDP-4-dehydrorhamnose 3,5-epimerase